MCVDRNELTLQGHFRARFQLRTIEAMQFRDVYLFNAAYYAGMSVDLRLEG